MRNRLEIERGYLEAEYITKRSIWTSSIRNNKILYNIVFKRVKTYVFHLN